MDLLRAVVRLRDARASKLKSKLSLENALFRLFGLGGRYPDSSTNFFQFSPIFQFLHAAKNALYGRIWHFRIVCTPWSLLS